MYIHMIWHHILHPWDTRPCRAGRARPAPGTPRAQFDEIRREKAPLRRGWGGWGG